MFTHTHTVYIENVVLCRKHAHFSEPMFFCLIGDASQTI